MFLMDNFHFLIVLIELVLQFLLFFQLFTEPGLNPGYLTFFFLRSISHKHIKNIAYRFAVYKMSVIVQPAYRAVFADNPVFHIIQIVLAVGNLLLNAFFHHFQVVRVYDAAE